MPGTHPYPNLETFCFFGFKGSDRMPDEKYDILMQKANIEAEKGDFLNAMMHAKKAAILYGLPGICLLSTVYMQLINQKVKEGEHVFYDVIRCSAYIKLAQFLFEDTEAKAMLTTHWPDNKINRDYFTSMLTELLAMDPKFQLEDNNEAKIQKEFETLRSNCSPRP